ncbi:odorant receptor 131-2-like [Genypterus blacodes]|uniref:odorant receptor 131-2-like n=1 Tax=Genypterus blacodes TaxID=154954 RepID=UPI003F775BC3
MNSSSDGNVTSTSTGLLNRDTLHSAVIKNVIVLALGITINYINGTLIWIFMKHQIFYMNPRYILFIHLVVNDMIQLTTTTTLFVMSYVIYRLPVPLCCILVVFAVFTTSNSPLNLAVMAIECYIAICLPLRYHELCTVRKTYILIGWIWAMSAVSILPDVIMMIATEPAQFLNSRIFCNRETMFRHPLIIKKRDIIYNISSIAIWLTLIFSYFRIFFAAKAAVGDSKKARNTILLHGFQLLLCMLTYIGPVLSKRLRYWFPHDSLTTQFVLYIIIQIMPRFVSPAVYGLRDQMFRKYLKQYQTCTVTASTNLQTKLNAIVDDTVVVQH